MPRFMDALMNETICYGGMAARRCEVYRDALATLLTRPDCPSHSSAKKAADMFAFGPRAVALTKKEAATLPQFDPTTREPQKA